MGFRFLVALCLLTCAAAPAKKPYAPFVAPASDEGEMAVAQFELPEGFKADLFAAEPRLANPVSFYIDDRNRFFVVETFRRKSAVIDIRNQMHWLDDDTASRKVSMRIAMVKKFLDAPTVATMTKDSERVRLIEDRDGDGKADFDTVFADGFNRLEDGIAAGVLVRGDDVYFANVPSLWRLRDTNGDGAADARDELHYGYGVRYNFNGHDLHGLRFGPDGKLYFSMGDRGLHVEKTPDGRTVSDPDSGAVLRCNPDGTGLEVFATGLRNPQELAFDEFGNLFTGDNNCDAGDKARWVYVVEGGDTGWRVGYQNQDWPVTRGPWMHEGLWMSDPPYPAAYIIPPVIELDASGPSGLTYDPGTGMPEEFRGRFFLADFRGGPANSSVHAIKLAPKGAGFEVVEQKPIFGNVLCTDVEIGYDGLYVSDWTNGWVTTGKGRLYRLYHEQAIKDPAVAETRKLMGEGMGKRPPAELGKLLSHPDQRVRQAAQFELASRGGEEPAAVFLAAAKQTDHRLARLHGVWGLGQLARKSPALLDGILPLTKDADAEVRAATLRVLGDARYAPAYDALRAGVDDASPRVQFFAVIGLSKLKRHEAMGRVAQLLRDNADRDPYIRHACVMALARTQGPGGLAQMKSDSSRSLRMGALLALRRLEHHDVALFLDDKDSAIVLEAARAINDVPIEAAMPKLAALIGREGLSEPVVTRVLNANYRAGTSEAATALARYASASGGPEEFRVQALRMLGAWAEVPGRDRVTGNWRPLPPRDAGIAKDAAGPILPEILRTAPDAVRVEAAGLVTHMGVGEPALLAELANDPKLKPKLRAAALGALAQAGDLERLGPTVEAALKDGDVVVRAAGVRALGQLPGALQRLTSILNGKDGASSASVPEQQAAIATLATLPGEEVDALIIDLMKQMNDGGNTGHVPPEIRLDVLEAAAARKSPLVAEALRQYESTRDSADPVSPFRETLAGGDAAAGEEIFRNRIDVSCIRCHAIKKKGGNAGPDLAGVGLRQNRAQLLESLIQPGKVIAPGFETVAVRLKDGTTYAGQIKMENEQTLQIVDPGKTDVRIDKSQIKSRRGGMSGMPDNIAMTLSRQDVRNLVEFLASLTEEPKPKKRKQDEPAATGDKTE